MSNGGSDNGPAINTIRLEETRTSRSFEARFTDKAVKSLSVPLGGFLAGGMNTPVRGAVRPSVPFGSRPTHEQLALPTAVPDLVEAEAIVDASQPDSKGATKETARQRLHRIFIYDDDRLRLQDSRLKAQTKMDFVERLSCLFLYAHALEVRSQVRRGELNAILSEATVYDGHARNWIANTTDLLSRDGMVELSVPGRERAAAILDQIHDPGVAGSWILGSRTRRRSARPDGASDGESEATTKTGRRKRRGNSADVAKWTEAWKSLGLEIDAHSILRNRTNADKALFGLWAIRRAAGDDGRVVSRRLLGRFILDAFEFQVHERTLEKALESEVKKGNALSAGGTSFQINQSGIEYVEQMAGLRSGSPPTAASSNTPAASA